MSFRPTPEEPDPLFEWVARTEKALGIVLDDPDEVSRLDVRVVLDAHEVPWITVTTPVAPGQEAPKYFLPLHLLEDALPDVTPDGFDGLETLLHRLVLSTEREEIENAFPGVRTCSEDADTLAKAVCEPVVEEVRQKLFQELLGRLARGSEWSDLGDQMALATLARIWMLDAMHELLKDERPSWFKRAEVPEASKQKPPKHRKRKSHKRRR